MTTQTTQTTQTQHNQKRVKVKYMLFPFTTDYDYTTDAEDAELLWGITEVITEVTELLKKYNSNSFDRLLDEIRKLAQEEVKCITYKKRREGGLVIIDVSRCSNITQFATSLFLFLKKKEELEEVELRVSTIDALLPLSRRNSNIELSICAMQCVEIPITSVIPIVSDLAAIYLLHYHHSHS